MVGSTKLKGLDIDISEYKWLSTKMWCGISELNEFDSFYQFA